MASTLSPPQQQPKVRRKPSTRRARAGSHLPPVQTQETHDAALYSIRAFLKGRNSYDAFPVSFRLIVLDTKLNVKKALQCLLLNGVVSAPLWNSEKSKFAGMLTVLDIIHLIQYYYHTANYATATADVETFKLESLRDIEKLLGVAPPPLLHGLPTASLFDAAKMLIRTHARRLPLLDYDTETGHEVIVSVLTQYRLLKFISINCAKDVSMLHLPLRKLKIGTYVQHLPPEETPEGRHPYWPISTASLSTPVFDLVHIFSEQAISAVPIIDDDGVVVNLYETVDVITLVRLGAYQSLDLTVSEALNQRAPDFPGVVICTASDSLGIMLQLLKKRRVHRLVVVEGEEEEKAGGKKGRLLGIITLSDVLRYVIGEVGIGEALEPGEDAETAEDTGKPPEDAPASGPPSVPASIPESDEGSDVPAATPAEPPAVVEPSADAPETSPADPGATPTEEPAELRVQLTTETETASAPAPETEGAPEAAPPPDTDPEPTPES